MLTINFITETVTVASLILITIHKPHVGSSIARNLCRGEQIRWGLGDGS